MKEQLISFETAKLTKEKGFDILSYYGYLPNGTLTSHPDIGDFEKNYYAPAQSLLQRWLREVHGIHVEILYRYYAPIPDYGCGIKTKEGCIASTIMPDKMAPLYAITLNPYPTYEEAFEAGLLKALNLI